MARSTSDDGGSQFNAQHPHAPAGTPAGGEFTKKDSGGSKPAPPKQSMGKPPPKQSMGSKPTPKAATRQAGTLKRGGANDAGQVKQLQALLSELGVSGIAVDGVFGPATEAAVKAAQSKLGLKPTGRASSALTRRLHDAHALSPCVPKSGSKVSAAEPVVAADGEVHTGAMIALIPADEDARRLESDEGEPFDELHCTLAYLGEAADFSPEERAALIQAVTEAVVDLGSIEADGFAVNMFNPTGDDPCVVLGLSGAKLAAAKDAIVVAVEGVDLPEQHEPWIPHVTLEYTDDPSVVSEYVDQTGPIVFDRVRVAFGGENTDIAMSTPVAAAAGHDTTAGHDNLHHYWTRDPEGLARWVNSPTPWTTLLANLVKEVDPPKPLETLKKWASAWFLEHFHYAAGSDLNRVNHGKPPRGDVVGPG